MITFHVYVKGDRSVGIQPIEATVSFNDDILWDDDMIAQAKESLAGFYDTPVLSVLTENEYQIEMEKRKKEYEEGTI